jgi:hypothetical protein
MSGHATVNTASGQCLQLIARDISLGGASAIASTCSGLGGNTGKYVMLVN